MRVLLSIITILFSICSFAQTPQKVAVYVTGDVNNGYKKVIGSKLVSGIVKSGEYSAVERTNDFLAALTKEQDYQMSGAVNDKQIVEIGLQFGVHYVLVADVSEIFESVFISARMIDVQTGLITHSAEVDMQVTSTKDLITITDIIIKKMKLVITLEVIGPIRSIKELSYVKIPRGYKICNTSEIEKYHKRFNLNFPIIVNIIENYVDHPLAHDGIGWTIPMFSTKFHWLEDTSYITTEVSITYARYNEHPDLRGELPNSYFSNYGKFDILTQKPAYIYIMKIE